MNYKVGRPPAGVSGTGNQGSTPERLLEINRDDLVLWRGLVKKAGIPLK